MPTDTLVFDCDGNYRPSFNDIDMPLLEDILTGKLGTESLVLGDKIRFSFGLTDHTLRVFENRSAEWGISAWTEVYSYQVPGYNVSSKAKSDEAKIKEGLLKNFPLPTVTRMEDYPLKDRKRWAKKYPHLAKRLLKAKKGRRK